MALTDAPKVEHSAFGKALAERILTQGPITLAEYMDVCAVEYYSTRKPFGKEGDFITSPELSPMFGESIGVWMADLWGQMGKPSGIRLVELGPGRGVLSRDILTIFRALPDGPKIKVHLVEISPALRLVQGETLKDNPPTWYDKFEDVPPGPMFLVANEFITALPIRQYYRASKRWHEKLVAFDTASGEFIYALREEPSDPVLPKGYRAPIDRDIFEVNEAGNSVTAAIARNIGQYGGAGIIIDYGFAEPTYGDTIQSYKRNQRADILRNPGGQDVTANVDFSALVEAAAISTQVHGPVTQADFLLRMGITERCEAFCQSQSDGKKRGEARLALRRLTGASELGTKFKVIAMTGKDGKLHPKGFTDGADIPDNRP